MGMDMGITPLPPIMEIVALEAMEPVLKIEKVVQIVMETDIVTLMEVGLLQMVLMHLFLIQHNGQTQTLMVLEITLLGQLLMIA